MAHSGIAGTENGQLYAFQRNYFAITQHTGCTVKSAPHLEFSPAIRYIAKYDEQEEILYISVLDALQSQKDEEVDEDK